MSEVCPDHGSVEAVLEWCASDDRNVHLGARCPVCRLWLRWLATRRGAPRLPDDVPVFEKG